jgi:hypothetical protein
MIGFKRFLFMCGALLATSLAAKASEVVEAWTIDVGDESGLLNESASGSVQSATWLSPFGDGVEYIEADTASGTWWMLDALGNVYSGVIPSDAYFYPDPGPGPGGQIYSHGEGASDSFLDPAGEGKESGGESIQVRFGRVCLTQQTAPICLAVLDRFTCEGRSRSAYQRALDAMERCARVGGVGDMRLRQTTGNIACGTRVEFSCTISREQVD